MNNAKTVTIVTTETCITKTTKPTKTTKTSGKSVSAITHRNDHSPRTFVGFEPDTSLGAEVEIVGCVGESYGEAQECKDQDDFLGGADEGVEVVVG